MADRKQLLLQAQRLNSSASKVIISLLIITLLMVTVSILGCQREQNQVDKSFTSPTEQKKAELLRKIDRKFENPQAHYELGQIYQTQGVLVRAEEEYTTAVSFDPAHRGAQAGLVKVLLDMGDTAKSQTEAERYIRLTSVSAVESLKLAMAFQQQQLDEYAVAAYRQALNLAPNSAKVNRQIGYYYLSKGEKDRAKDYLVRSYQIDPYQPEVARELGQLGVELKIPTKAESNSKELDKMLEKSDEQLTQ
ncbi:MAG: tetratricopeptide repeat protein [Planctomycetota bacterium]|jgi:Tfp pilus assembly protein PilF